MNFNKENFIKIRLELYKLIEADVIESLTHQELSEQLLKQVEQVARDHSLPTTSSEKQRYVTELVNELVGLGPLQELVDDKNISDIMVNGPEKVFIERNGKSIMVGTFKRGLEVNCGRNKLEEDFIR